MKGRSKAESTTTDARLKKKAAPSRKASKKAAKDPNKPKRPPSAFFVFMEEFRQEFKRKNPNNKSVAAVGKAAGEKWKAMSDAEKAPYVAKAEKRKIDYTKNLAAYNKKQASGGDDDSDKSKSEVNDEEDEEDEEEEDEDDDE